MKGHSQTPSTAPSLFNEVATGHSILPLHFRNVLGRFIDSESGDLRGNIEVSKIEFKPTSGACALTARLMKCSD